MSCFCSVQSGSKSHRSGWLIHAGTVDCQSEQPHQLQQPPCIKFRRAKSPPGDCGVQPTISVLSSWHVAPFKMLKDLSWSRCYLFCYTMRNKKSTTFWWIIQQNTYLCPSEMKNNTDSEVFFLRDYHWWACMFSQSKKKTRRKTLRVADACDVTSQCSGFALCDQRRSRKHICTGWWSLTSGCSLWGEEEEEEGLLLFIVHFYTI